MRSRGLDRLRVSRDGYGDVSRTRRDPSSREEGEAPLDLTSLVQLTEQLAGQTRGVGQRFIEMVDALSDSRAQLVLLPDTMHPAATAALRWAHCAAVRFSAQEYGMIVALAPTSADTHPPLSSFETSCLAQACSLALHLLELAALIEGFLRRLPLTPIEPLTQREQEVLLWMARGLEPEAIAATLHISPGTVDKHQEHIYAKLQAHSFVDAVLIAHRSGMTRFLVSEGE